VRRAGHVAWKINKKCILNWIMKCQENKLLGRLRYRWENDIKLDFRETACDDMYLNGLVQECHMLGLNEHGNEPSSSIKQDISCSAE
jgi:hypothetical protein